MKTPQQWVDALLDEHGSGAPPDVIHITPELLAEVIFQAQREAAAEALKGVPTEADLAGIAERHALSTPGTWHSVSYEDGAQVWDDEGDTLATVMQGPRVGDFFNDALFIAEAHQDVPKLLAALAQRDRILHDVTQDGGVRRGEQAMLSRCLELLDQRITQIQPDQAGSWNSFNVDTNRRAAVQHVRGMLAGLEKGEPQGAQMPPDEARAEVLRLRGLLREIEWHSRTPANGERIRQVLAAALGEDEVSGAHSA